MELFIYNETTLEYTGIETQYIDPEETKKAGKDIYIKVTNGTKKEPLPQKENETNIFVGGKWKIVADFRNIEAYYKEDATKVNFSLGDVITKDMTIKSPLGFQLPEWNKKLKVWVEKEEEVENTK